jgi:hypothetical protein
MTVRGRGVGDLTIVSPRNDHAPVPLRLEIRIANPMHIIVVPTGSHRIHLGLGLVILK